MPGHAYLDLPHGAIRQPPDWTCHTVPYGNRQISSGAMNETVESNNDLSNDVRPYRSHLVTSVLPSSKQDIAKSKLSWLKKLVPSGFLVVAMICHTECPKHIKFASAFHASSSGLYVRSCFTCDATPTRFRMDLQVS